MAKVLIIGANRGLGLEFVRQYAQAGWQVLATVRDPAKGRGVSEAGAQVYVMDAGDPSSIRRLAASLAGVELDMIVHNAGIFGHDQELGGVDPDAFLEVVRVNTVGPLLVAQALAERLVGRKVFAAVSSNMGAVSDNTTGGHYAYRASKAALNMVIKGLSVDLGPRGITTIALSPGWVRTDMGGPEAPLSPPESVAGMIAVLNAVTAGDSGTFIRYDAQRLPW